MSWKNKEETETTCTVQQCTVNNENAVRFKLQRVVHKFYVFLRMILRKDSNYIEMQL